MSDQHNPTEIGRPGRDEYADYYHTYVGIVPSGSVVAHLQKQRDDITAFFEGLSEQRLDSRYQPDKWTMKEVLGHVIDSERVFADRAMRFARGDTTPLPGIDQNVLMERAEFQGRALGSMLSELHHLRSANLDLFESFSPEVLLRRGVASEVSFSVRSLVFIIAGHADHHLRVLKERY